MNKFIISLTIPVIAIIIMWFAHVNSHVDTMLNQWSDTQTEVCKQIDQQALWEAVDYHKQEPAFARRPLTTLSVEFVSQLLHIKIGTAFILVNFFLFFLCGIVLYFLSLAYGLNYREALFSQFIFYTGFTILFAFFNTNYTYDEPLNYLLLLLALLSFFKQHHFLFFIFMLLACICRESSYLFVPFFLYSLFFTNANSNSNQIRYAYLGGFVLVVLLHCTFLYFYYPSVFSAQSHSELISRMSLFEFNFQNKTFGLESIISFFIVCSFPIYMLFRYRNEIQTRTFSKNICVSFFVLLIINSLIVLFTTIARESRLFALPLLLVYPYMGKYLMQESLAFKTIKYIIPNKQNFVILILHLGIFLLFAYLVNTKFETTIQPKKLNFNAEYLKILALVLLSFNLRYLCMKTKTIAGLDTYT